MKTICQKDMHFMFYAFLFVNNDKVQIKKLVNY